MKIKIPEGKYCFRRDFCVFLDGRRDWCNLFKNIVGSCGGDKCDQCLEEFGDGGEFELVKKEKEEI